MIVVPAIDIKGGKVVRLTQGAADSQTVYSDDPVEMARRWASFGVDMIHVVDLDGAFEGKPVNLDIVKKIAASVKAKVELGGGIRSEAAIKKAFDAGVSKIVIGTKALDEKFIAMISKAGFRDKIVIGIDAKDGVVYTKGWVDRSEISAVSLVKEVADLGIKTINYTDISKDGMLEGPNIESIKKILDAAALDIIVAGGVSSIDDVRRLKELERDGLKGMIIGKALYEKKIDLGEAIKICSQKE